MYAPPPDDPAAFRDTFEFRIDSDAEDEMYKPPPALPPMFPEMIVCSMATALAPDVEEEATTLRAIADACAAAGLEPHATPKARPPSRPQTARYAPFCAAFVNRAPQY